MNKRIEQWQRALGLVTAVLGLAGVGVIFSGTAEGASALVQDLKYSPAVEIRSKAESPVMAEIPETKEVPVIDGRLDEACWQNAAQFTGFLLVNRTPAREQTVVRMLFDRNNLYVGFECLESQMGKLKELCVQHDDKVWYDDEIEFFVDVFNEKKTYVHILVNAKGTVYDEKGWIEDVMDAMAAEPGKKKEVIKTDVSYEMKAEVKTGKGKDRWWVEMRIPAQDMGLEEIIPGSRWGVLLCREEQARPETSSYPLTTGAFCDPRLFGEIQMGRAICTLDMLSTGNRYYGKNSLKGRVKNVSGEKRSVKVNVKVNSGGRVTEDQKEGVEVEAGKGYEWEHSYVLEGKEGEVYQVEVKVRDGKSQEVYARKEIAGKIPRLMELNLKNQDYYVGEDGEANVQVNVGDQTMKQSRVELTVRDGEKKVVKQGEIKPVPACGMRIKLGLGDLPTGHYRLEWVLYGEKDRELTKGGTAVTVMKNIFE